jgi:CheY-like chemotaxis protein
MKKILLIDDDHLVVKSLARLLEKEGFTISCAESGLKALELIEQTNFDLIISDIRMPGIDGIEIAKKVRETLKQVPIIFITGYSDSQSYDRSKAVNPSDFIYKPFDKDKFLQSIKAALGNK